MSTVLTSTVLHKCDPDEPIFVLCGRDPGAAKCVRDWASRACIAGVPAQKISDALKVAEQMDEWPNKKRPD